MRGSRIKRRNNSSAIVLRPTHAFAMASSINIDGSPEARCNNPDDLSWLAFTEHEPRLLWTSHCPMPLAPAPRQSPLRCAR
eukprot:scaffold253990_cov31-Tisochrysis_lutea.AAC.2